jgi:hypothetical protein
MIEAIKIKKSKKNKGIIKESTPNLSSFLLSQTIETDSALNDIFATSVRYF